MLPVMRSKMGRAETGANQKMDRSKKGPPEVPHRERALGDLWGTDFEGVLGDLRGSGEGVGGGPPGLIFGAGLFFGA